MTGHGGNVFLASDETGIPVNEMLDFSASINPLGVPESVSAVIRENIGLLVHYPEPFADSISRDLSQQLGVPAQSLVCGNGSTELIYLLVRALRPRRVLMPGPTFSEYERACHLNDGTSCTRFDLSPQGGFAIDPGQFVAAMAGCDMAFLCNPNNPTGRLLERKTVLDLVRAAERAGCLLVVDEAFIDFTPDQSLVRDVEGNSHLIVLRSLTKFYALSGLRIGYGIFPDRVVQQVSAHKEPWTVNTLAQMAAATAIRDRGYQERTMEVIFEEKEYLEQGFQDLGIAFFPSSTNYYLLRISRGNEVAASLRKRGILVRDCRNFPGLDESYIRVAVRSRNENNRLLKELGDLCAR
ncbi:MAG: threonine-phosphate decarboxylase CobD [Desulfobulbaceae bacterium]